MELAKRFLTLLTVVTLASCASPPDYRKADTSGDYGYSETKLEDNRFRITFTGDRYTPSSDVQDYALLRAAELTSQRGYTWFKTIERDTSQEQSGDAIGRTVIAPGFGFTTCDARGCFYTQSVTRPSYIGPEQVAGEQYATTLEIVMGKGDVPAKSDRVYNAAEVSANLRAQLEDD